MKSSWYAPVAAGGGLVTGLAAAMVSGYHIVDCLQFRTQKGECNEVVEQHTLTFVSGVAAVVGTIGGLFTYNRQLEREPDTRPDISDIE